MSNDLTHHQQLFTPVILCGGSGTRLWPLSRNGFPKQFLALHGDETLFQLATRRLMGLAAPDLQAQAPLIVTNEGHRFLVADQLLGLGLIDTATQLLEPKGRNTAPAITLAALAASASSAGSQDQDIEAHDPVLVVAPADQIVTDPAAFTQALQQAIRCAAQGAFTVLGVKPTHPETGFGYIECDQTLGDHDSYGVVGFREKPNLITAQSYVDSGRYLWNSGIFVVKASVWLKAIEAFAEDVFTSVSRSWRAARVDDHFVRPDAEAFLASPDISADYAVLENCPGSAFEIRMVELDAGWNDLGAWDAVWQVGDKTVAGNVTHGDAIVIDTKDTLVHANYRLVAAVGVKDLVIVETADAVLVGHRKHSQQIKAVVKELAAVEREEHNLHRKVHRPWGWYDSIDEEEKFKVKRIMVKPGASLSLQKHHHRAEHWIVVSGVAEVTCDDRVITLQTNESTYIPQGSVHRLANKGSQPLEIIEVQSGLYLGEDDIVRLEDHYGRTN
jgi:mannose-1-phosphate guanylyltransferase / mannose-6-phosphate isomerase